uniref:C2 domain-containing protein n=2 Tax=Setaria TaxID=4554 RepID=K3XXJ2_SETIT
MTRLYGTERNHPRADLDPDIANTERKCKRPVAHADMRDAPWLAASLLPRVLHFIPPSKLANGQADRPCAAFLRFRGLASSPHRRHRSGVFVIALASYCSGHSVHHRQFGTAWSPPLLPRLHLAPLRMSIHGLVLEVRVTGCRKLRDTEFFTRQDPYVVLEYATTKHRTRTCTDGGRNPTFDEKFHIPLIEGLRELNVVVWNSNTLTHDDFIGSGRVYLHKVLTNGYDDSSWSLQTRHMRSAGEVKLIMHVDVSAMNKMGRNIAASSTHSVPPPSMPAPALASAVPYTGVPPSYPPASAYPAPSAYPAYPTPSQSPYTTTEYPPPPQQAYPPSPAGYPPPSYPPQPYGEPYLPQPYGQPYPPPPAAQSPYPPAPYPGTYPPRPY